MLIGVGGDIWDAKIKPYDDKIAVLKQEVKDIDARIAFLLTL
jgi:predicted lipoprotein